MESIEEEVARYRKYAEILRHQIVDSVTLIHEDISRGYKVLVEGANAALLDIDFGTYPFAPRSRLSLPSRASREPGDVLEHHGGQRLHRSGGAAQADRHGDRCGQGLYHARRPWALPHRRLACARAVERAQELQNELQNLEVPRSRPTNAIEYACQYAKACWNPTYLYDT